MWSVIERTKNIIGGLSLWLFDSEKPLLPIDEFAPSSVKEEEIEVVPLTPLLLGEALFVSLVTFFGLNYLRGGTLIPSSGRFSSANLAKRMTFAYKNIIPSLGDPSLPAPFYPLVSNISLSFTGVDFASLAAVQSDENITRLVIGAYANNKQYLQFSEWNIFERKLNQSSQPQKFDCNDADSGVFVFSFPGSERFGAVCGTKIQLFEKDGTPYLDRIPYATTYYSTPSSFSCIQRESEEVFCAFANDGKTLKTFVLNPNEGTIVTPTELIRDHASLVSISSGDEICAAYVAYGSQGSECSYPSASVLAFQCLDEGLKVQDDPFCFADFSVNNFIKTFGATGVGGEELFIIASVTYAPSPYSGMYTTSFQVINPRTGEQVVKPMSIFSKEFFSTAVPGADVSQDADGAFYVSMAVGNQGVVNERVVFNGSSLITSGKPTVSYDGPVSGQLSSDVPSGGGEAFITYSTDQYDLKMDVGTSDRSALAPVPVNGKINGERGENKTLTLEDVKFIVGGVVDNEVLLQPNCSQMKYFIGDSEVQNFTQGNVEEGLVTQVYVGDWEDPQGEITATKNGYNTTVTLENHFSLNPKSPITVSEGTVAFYLERGSQGKVVARVYTRDFSPSVVAANITKAGGDPVPFSELSIQGNDTEFRELLLEMELPSGVTLNDLNCVLRVCNSFLQCDEASLTLMFAKYPEEPSELQAWAWEALKAVGLVVGPSVTVLTIAVAVLRHFYAKHKEARGLKEWRTSPEEGSEFAERLRRKLNVWGYKKLNKYPQFKHFAEAILKAIEKRDEKKWDNLSNEHKKLLVERVALAISSRDEGYLGAKTHIQGIGFWKGVSFFGKNELKLPEAKSDAMGKMVTNIAGKVSTTGLRSSSLCIRVEPEDEELRVLKKKGEEDSDNSSYLGTSVGFGGADGSTDTSFSSNSSFGGDRNLFSKKDLCASNESLTSLDSETSISSTGSSTEALLTGKEVKRKYKPQ